MKVALVLLLLACSAVSSTSADWQPSPPKLPTRWSKDVNPQAPHPEYPRPEMTRVRWQSLNGVWQFASAAEGEAPPLGRALSGRILVPFPVESALSGVGQRHPRVWYRRAFTIPAAWSRDHVLLHFEAANWESVVFVNGKPLGSHRGGYDPFSFDITDALSPGGEQELVVGVYNPADAGDQPRGKQMNAPNNETFYTAATGLWQSAWLEPVPEAHIEDVIATPDVDARSVSVRVVVEGASGLEVQAQVLDGGKPVAQATGPTDGTVRISLPRPVLWTPDKPFLYDLKVALMRGGKAIDSVGSYFGMRKVSVKSDGRWPRIMLNDRFIFQVGLLDQGYWPDGIYTAPTEAAMKYDLEMTKTLGFNMIRKHVKVEPRRWYYWADRMGILVWQDMPFATDGTPESKTQFAVELQRMVESRRHHPSIISWTIFNESFGQHDTEQLAAWLKRFDPKRLVNSASGGTDKGVGDVYDQHSYPSPISLPAKSPRASVVGEFGGLGLKVPGHTWNDREWSYQAYTSSEDLTTRYERLLSLAWRKKDEIGLSAVVYTQTTDVEAELNGLVTYDRAVVKMDAARVAAANRGEYHEAPLTMLVPNAMTAAAEWRYTTDTPVAGWNETTFDDANWQTGRGGFGSAGTMGAIVSTPWTTRDIWLRREFTLPGETPDGLVISIHHDEDAEIYINGVLAARAPGFDTDYDERPLTSEARASLRPGRNVLAVHCRNEAGGQNVDVGLGWRAAYR